MTTLVAAEAYVFREVEYRAADIEHVDADGGTVLMRAAPYDAEVELMPKVWESFAAKAFSRAAAAPHRVKMWHEHLGPLIGHATEVEDRPDGIWVRQKFSNTPAAQEARELAKDGTLDQCSVTFRPMHDFIRKSHKPDGVHFRHSRGYLLGVALCAHGAYGDLAYLAEVRDADPDKEIEMMRRDREERMQRLLALKH